MSTIAIFFETKENIRVAWLMITLASISGYVAVSRIFSARRPNRRGSLCVFRSKNSSITSTSIIVGSGPLPFAVIILARLRGCKDEVNFAPIFFAPFAASSCLPSVGESAVITIESSPKSRVLRMSELRKYAMKVSLVDNLDIYCNVFALKTQWRAFDAIAECYWDCANRGLNHCLLARNDSL